MQTLNVPGQAQTIKPVGRKLAVVTVNVSRTNSVGTSEKFATEAFNSHVSEKTRVSPRKPARRRGYSGL